MFCSIHNSVQVLAHIICTDMGGFLWLLQCWCIHHCTRGACCYDMLCPFAGVCATRAADRTCITHTAAAASQLTIHTVTVILSQPMHASAVTEEHYRAHAWLPNSLLLHVKQVQSSMNACNAVLASSDIFQSSFALSCMTEQADSRLPVYTIRLYDSTWLCHVCRH